MLLRVDDFHYEGLSGKPWFVLLNLSSIGDVTRRLKPVRVYAYYSLVLTLCRKQGSIAFCLMWKTQTYIIKIYCSTYDIQCRDTFTSTVTTSFDMRAPSVEDVLMSADRLELEQVVIKCL